MVGLVVRGGGANISSCGTTRPRRLGPDLVTNGGFASGSNWTADAGWSIAAGVSTATAAAAGNFTRQSINFTAGKRYRVTYTVTSFTSGDVVASTSANTLTVRNSAATFTEDFEASANATELRFGRSTGDFTGAIDNVIVQEVID